MTVSKYETMRGTFYKARVEISRDPKTNKRRYMKKAGFTSSKAAKIWERQTLVDDDAGEFEEIPERMTLDDLYQTWFDAYKTKVRQSTANKTDNFMRTHVLTADAFAGVYVDKIKPVDLQLYLNRMAGVRADYKKAMHPFRATMKLALIMGMIRKNPFDVVEFPAGKPVPVYSDRLDYYTVDQLKRFMDAANNLYAAKNFEVVAFFRLLAFTGMRRGEVLALTWDDVNLTDRTISITKSLSQSSGTGVVIGGPKTPASKRVINFDQKTAQTLRTWRAKQSAALMSSGRRGSNIVITGNDLVSHLAVSSPRKWLIQIADASGLPRIKVHGFRHTYATLAVQSNMSIKALQYQLGHDDVKTTLAIYTALPDEVKNKTADVFTSLVNF